MAIGAPRTGSGRLLPATAAAGAAALVAAGVSSSRASASACQPYTATAHDAAPAPGEPFVGTGVYRLVSHLVVTGGGTGQLELQGTVNFVTPTADGRFTGAMCPG